MSKSKIEWTDKTWNPVSGCSKVSQGCKNCYAERDWPRLSSNPKTVYFERKFTDVMCHQERLQQPLQWKKPCKIFVNSMSDLFHEDVPDSFILEVFGIIFKAKQHIFQILTKRPERMREFVTSRGIPKNIWLGVSVEDQKTAEERIPILLDTPSVSIRWISAEPLLAKLSIKPFLFQKLIGGCLNMKASIRSHNNHHLDWIVVGGESGKNARPMNPNWLRSIRDQCQEANIPFMFKQWGEWAPNEIIPGGDLGGDMRKGLVKHVCLDRENDGYFRRGDDYMRRVGKKKSGRFLDGQIYDEYPEVTT